MKISKVIALSSLTAALCTILIVAGSYIDVLDLSCLFLASIVLMMPISKGSFMGAFLAYLASLLLGFLLGGMRFQIIIPYAMFFGLHPIVNGLQKKYKINKIIAFILKTVWFIGSMYVIYYFTTMFVVEIAFVKNNVNWLIPVVSILVFSVYDPIMNYFQMYINRLINRLKL